MWIHARFGFFDDKGSVRFCSSSEYFNKNRFGFGSSSVNVGSGSVLLGFFIDGIERCFRVGHLLWINCNSKYQLID